MKKRSKFLAILFLSTALVMGGCGASTISDTVTETVGADSEATKDAAVDDNGMTSGQETKQESTETVENNMAEGSTAASSDTLIDTSDIFTDRDMEQEADLSEAEYITFEDGKDVTISTEGVYVIQ